MKKDTPIMEYLSIFCIRIFSVCCIHSYVGIIHIRFPGRNLQFPLSLLDTQAPLFPFFSSLVYYSFRKFQVFFLFHWNYYIINHNCLYIFHIHQPVKGNLIIRITAQYISCIVYIFIFILYHIAFPVFILNLYMLHI